MDLFPAILFYTRVRICLCFGGCLVVESHGIEPFLLASGTGVRCLLGLDDVSAGPVCNSALGTTQNTFVFHVAAALRDAELPVTECPANY